MTSQNIDLSSLDTLYVDTHKHSVSVGFIIIITQIQVIIHIATNC
jgi:hypothetical protein